MKGIQQWKKITQKITSRGQVVYIFTEPNQPIELVVKAKKVDTVLKALEALKEYDISQKVQQFNYYTNGNLKDSIYLWWKWIQMGNELSYN